MLIREINLLKFVEQFLELEGEKTTSQPFSEKIATDNWASTFKWASILLSRRNLPSCCICSLVTRTLLIPFVSKFISTETNYLKFADTFNNRSKQFNKTCDSNKYHPPFCWVIWIHHWGTPILSFGFSSFFFGAGTIRVATTKQQLLKPREMQVVAGLDLAVGGGRGFLGLKGRVIYQLYP